MCRSLLKSLMTTDSWIRILLAQPEMDEKTLEGRVVAERVYRGLRRKEPVVLSDIAHKPDFRLVPKDEEADFCQWNKIRDFDLARDAERKPKFISMPPLMKKVLEKNRQKRGLAIEDESVFHLPAYKVYQVKVETVLIAVCLIFVSRVSSILKTR